MANLTGGFKTAAIASLPLDGTKMIVDVGGAEWRELLTAAGFAGIGILQTGTPFSIIQATAQ